ncbi:conserved hypothetical protein [delta proteobacterium NaphS2]|nr:conserved hypothetical protein [delta proteobacterium NaphS2]
MNARTESKALAPIEDGPKNYAMLPDRHEWNVLQAMAKTASNTRFFSQLGGEAGILSIMLYARELNIPPMAAVMGGFHNIQGRVEMSARLMTMRIRQAGHALKLKHLDHEKCIVYGKRTDTGEDMEAGYTFQEAQEAGLAKDGSNWMKFREDMLWARAISRLARRLYPDVVGTAYIEGEILEMIPTRSETRYLPEESKAVAPDFDSLEKKLAFDEEIPEDVDRERLEGYARICADHFGQDLEEFKQKILDGNQMEDFISAFRGWEQKNPTQPMDKGENAQQGGEELSGTPEKDLDPWDEFRDEFINLRQAGFSTWVFKNKDQMAEAPEAIQQEAMAKWEKLYPDNQWPLNSNPEESPKTDETETHPPHGGDGEIPPAWDMPKICAPFIDKLGKGTAYGIMNTDNPASIPEEERLSVIVALRKAAEDVQ